MVVALYFPHNEGAVAALVTGPGFDSGSLLVDAYEVDASLNAFSTLEEAQAYLLSEHAVDIDDLKPVEGGLVAEITF